MANHNDSQRRFKGGSKRKRDRNFGIDDEGFWEWWHLSEKAHYGGRDISSSAFAREMQEEYRANHHEHAVERD